jgi:hypothetical protein
MDAMMLKTFSSPIFIMRLPDIRARMISLFPRRAGRLFRTVAPAFQFQLQFQVRLLKRGHYGGFIASVTWLYRRSVIPAKLVPDDENGTVHTALCRLDHTRGSF